MNPLALASTLVLAPMAAVSLWNLARARRLDRAGEPVREPRVSLLIPARDEERNLRRTLPTFLRLAHPDLEILVLDDESSDATPALVEEAAITHPGRIRLIRGEPLPAGWLGKNWACHQLAQAARGEVLIFCDADVETEPEAVGWTLAAMERSGAAALTALPRQVVDGWAAAAVVPLVAQLPVATMLPLALVPLVSSPSLSMGNGQWFAFDRESYRACGGHAGVRGEVVEDVALARAVKAAGFRLEVAMAREVLRVRMYGSLDEVRAGFGKNLYALTGGRPGTFSVAVGVFGLAAIAPWVMATAGARGALLPLGLLTLVRLAGRRLFGHGVREMLLHPAGSLLVVAIGLESVRRAGPGAAWKGRVVNPSRRAERLL